MQRYQGTTVTQGVSLVQHAWSTVSKWVSGFMGSTNVSQYVGLAQLSWKTVSKWVKGMMGSTSTDQGVGLKQEAWKSVSKWVSGLMGTTDTDQGVGLEKLSWKTVSKWVSGFMGSTDTDQKVGLTKGWSGTPQKYLKLEGLSTTVKVGLEVDKGKAKVALTPNAARDLVTMQVKPMALGGILTAAGRVLRFASGGLLSGGGRPRWWNSVQKYASGTTRAHGTMFVGGEAGPEIIGHINGRTEILNKSQLAQTMYSAVSAGMLAALSKVRFRMPAMATGAVLPYEIAAQIARTGEAIEDTLNANNEDLIQVIISTIGAQTSALVAALQALRASGEGGVNAQQVIEEINRRTQMFGASPIMN